ncbi:MAG: sulfite exporter TauE/SafE family protein [Clostridiales bacterium]|nr:sulfite exporter TauE/SafE family protein [Clostridiales bacterium]MCF8023743.1 sulfite exporter TauE/SafE family protein [Clostridiales bacterium]
MNTLTTWFLGALIIGAASTVQAATGFGLALVSIPLLILIFNPKMAVGICIMVSFFSTLTLFFKNRHSTCWPVVKNILAGALPGMPLGLMAFSLFNVEVLKSFICFFIIILSMLMVFEVKLNIKKENTKMQILAGSLSGSMSSSIGISGPPVVILFSNLDLPKESFRASLVSYFIFIDTITYIGLLLNNSLPQYTNVFGFTFVPFVFLGTFLGNKFFTRIPAYKFKKLVLAMLIIISIHSIITTLL